MEHSAGGASVHVLLQQMLAVADLHHDQAAGRTGWDMSGIQADSESPLLAT